MGGLSRKAYMIQQIKNETDKPVLLLDAGALLFEKPVMPEPLLPARKAQAAGIIRAMRQMNYAAVGLAPQDLALGLSFIEQQAPLPWVSANLDNGTADRGIVQPFVIKQVAETSIAVIGLTDDQLNSEALSADRDFRVLPWRDALADTLPQVRMKSDMVILLSSYPEQVNRQIASEFDEIHLIIQSGRATGNKAPQLFGNALITQVGARGQYIGRLDIDWKSARRWASTGSGQLKAARDRLDRINWQLGRMEKRLQAGKRKENRDYQRLLKEKERTVGEISRLELLAGQEQDQLSSYTADFIGLRAKLPEDPEIREIVRQTIQAVNSMQQERLGNSPRGNRPDSGMNGWEGCQSCHPRQTRFWLQTDHAGAWRTLEKARQHFNRECLVCHVTLPTYDMEKVLREDLLAGLSEDLKGVGCEACHGPGRMHARQPGASGLRRPDRTTCLQCHTPDHDRNFVFEEKIRLIGCPPSRSISE